MDWFSWLRLALGDITVLIQNLARLLVSIGGFVADLAKEMATTVKLLTGAGNHVSGLLAFLPPAVFSVVISTFSVVILYKIFGREG